MTNMPIRVAIADDHAILRQGLAQLLRNASGIELVGEASDGDRLLETARELRPDVLVCDVSMPTYGAEQLTRELSRDQSPPAVIALTVHEEPEIARPILEAGVRGYVLKKNAFEELRNAIDVVHEGGRFISPTLAADLLATPNVDRTPDLTQREREVLIGIARGLPYKRLARELDISVRTVETYRERLLKKLDLGTTADLIRFATERSLVD